jgi:hypothetical protein
MHWGIRRFQPYRKGDRVKGGKEVGKATKVEQRSIADRVKKGIAAVNKIKKELHKGNLEKEQYKYEKAQLKEAQREVKKAKRRKAEENIRERIRERREQEREDRRLEEERRDRNLERARDIASSAAQIGTMVYGAYQLKKSFDASRAADNPVSIPQQTNSSGQPSTSSSNPTVHLSGTNSSGSSSPQVHLPHTSIPQQTNSINNPSGNSGTTPQIYTSGYHTQPTPRPLNITRSGHDTSSTNSIRLSSTSTTAAADAVQQAHIRANENRMQRAVREARERKQQTRQNAQNVTNALRSGQSRAENHSATLANANVNIMVAMEKLRGKVQNGTASDKDRNALRSLEVLNNRYDSATRSMMDHAQDLASVRMQNRGTLPGTHIGAATDRNDFNARFGNAAQRGAAKVKKFMNTMRTTDAQQRTSQRDSDARFINEMRRMQTTANAAKGINMQEADLIANATPDELIRRFAHYMKCRKQDELYHHGILGMHWGIRRFQPYRKGKRVNGGKEVGKATKVEQRESLSSKILRLTNKTEKEMGKTEKKQTR